MLQLFKANKNSTFQETRSVLTKLIQLTIETGMATAIGAIADLILFLVFPHNNMHFIMYVNHLLAFLKSDHSHDLHLDFYLLRSCMSSQISAYKLG